MRRSIRMAVLALAAGAAALAAGQVRAAPTGAGSPPVAQVSETTAAKLFDDCVRASGGPALAAIKAETRTGTLTRGPGGPVPLEIIAAAPGRWRYNQVFAWGDQQAFGYNGRSGWVADASGSRAMEPKQLFDLRVLLDPQAPLHLGELVADATVVGVEKVGGREAVTVRGRSPDGDSVELAFGRENGLLLRAGAMRFEDYRLADGANRPFRVRLGSAMVLEVNEMRHGDDVDPTLFETPACVLPAKDPPLYRPEKHVTVGIAVLDACVGEYRTPDGRTWKISRKDSHLMFASARSSFELLANSETDYVRGYSNVEFHFAKDPSGAVTGVVLVMPGRRVEAKKVR